MIDYIAIAVASVLVIVLIHRFNLVAQCKQVLAATKKANAIAANPQLSDREKETQTQEAAKALMALFGKVFIGSVAAFGLPTLAIWLLSMMGVFNLTHIVEVMSSLEFVLVFCVIFVVSLFISSKSKA